MDTTASRNRYPSDISDEEWDFVAPYLTLMKHDAPQRDHDLREVLSAVNQDATKMLVIEGVYSMEGHIARLPELAEIAEEHGCFTVIDDAHGFGVLGRQGRGTVDHFGLNEAADVVCGSLSKSLASTGGFVAASTEIIEYLRTHSKQTIFSAAISPSQAACAQASLELMQAEPSTSSGFGRTRENIARSSSPSGWTRGKAKHLRCPSCSDRRSGCIRSGRR